MRYQVKRVMIWTGEIVDKIYDTKNDYLSMTCYLNEDTVNRICNKLNNGIGCIT
jgi:hypothetical protein